MANKTRQDNDSNAPRLITGAWPAPAKGYTVPRPGSCVANMILAMQDDGATLFDLAVAYLSGQRTANPKQATAWAGWYGCDYKGAVCTYGYAVYAHTDPDRGTVYTARGPALSNDWILDAKAAVSPRYRNWCVQSIKDQIASGQQLGHAPHKAVSVKANKIAARRVAMASAVKTAATAAQRRKIAKDLGFTS